MIKEILARKLTSLEKDLEVKRAWAEEHFKQYQQSYYDVVEIEIQINTFKRELECLKL